MRQIVLNEQMEERIEKIEAVVQGRFLGRK